MVTYKRTIFIDGKTVRYVVNSTNRVSSPRMKYDQEGLTVIVPGSYVKSDIEKFIRENSAWITEHESERSVTGTPNKPLARSKEEYELLLKTIFTRMFHSSDLIKNGFSQMPSIRFRQMKTVIASYKIDKNELTFTRALTASPKRAITLAAAYGVALLSGTPGSEQFALVLNKICPDWRGIRSALPDSLRSSLSKL